MSPKLAIVGEEFELTEDHAKNLYDKIGDLGSEIAGMKVSMAEVSLAMQALSKDNRRAEEVLRKIDEIMFGRDATAVGLLTRIVRLEDDKKTRAELAKEYRTRLTVLYVAIAGLILELLFRFFGGVNAQN